MHTIDLIRHAESSWVQQSALEKVKRFGGRMNEIDLSDEGKEQAAQLGYFALQCGIRPLRVYSSPAVRATQTHEISARVMGMKGRPTVDDRLQEKSWGDWTGEPRSVRDEPRNLAERIRLGVDFAPPGGESISMVRHRMTEVLLEIAEDNPPGHYWVHGHRNAIKSVVGAELGWSPEEITENHLDVVSLTRVGVEAGKISLIFFNQPSLGQ